MNDLVSDIRFGARMLRKRLGTSILAVVALALGIGLTTTMFSIIYGLILKGLPFPEPDRIMHLGRVVGGGSNVQSAPLHDFVDWSASQTSFETLSAFTSGQATISDDAGSERYRVGRLSPSTLKTLRVAPTLGRDFTEADGQPDAPVVILLGDQAWNSQFGRNPDVINKAVRFNGNPATIIGVMPPRFGFPNSQQIWVPLQIKLASKRGEGTLVDVVGRLKPGVKLARARAEFDTIGGRLRESYPENKDVAVLVQPFMSRFVPQQISRTFYAMLVAVFGVMLIACANVANLQLARAAERTREVALRMALGAGRGRVMRQMLVEGLMLASVGALLGLALAKAGITYFTNAVADTNPPFWLDIQLHPMVLAFATGLTVVAALAASLIPALRATRQDVNAVLKDEGRGSTGLHMGRFSRGLVIGEVLLSCCLLVVSGLISKGVIAMSRISYPYPTSSIFVAGMAVPDVTFPDGPSRVRFIERVETAFRGVAGVQDVALATGSPDNVGTVPVAIEGKTYTTPKDQPNTRRVAITNRFFDTLQVRLSAGRMFAAQDTLDSEFVVIVDTAFAQKHFPGLDPLGRRVKLGTDPAARWLSIIGVVPQLATSRNNPAVMEAVYVPLTQAPTLGVTMFAAAAGNPLALAPALRRAAVAVHQDLALANPNSLAGFYRQQGWHFRVFGGLFMSFGLAAMLLASAGLYGVMAFSVRRRTNEIGVRMALGAHRSLIIRMVLFQGMWRCALGVVLGLVPAYYLGTAMRELIYNTTPTDPLVLTLTTIGLLGTGFLASIVPAMRAASVDPLKALRSE